MHVRRMVTVLAGLLLAAGARSQPQTIAIAGFDYTDTSGEVRDQSAEHAARLADFLRTLQAGLGGRAVILDCAPTCTAGVTAPDVLLERSRETGATLLVYGGIHKVSTLIQQAVVQMVDIRQNRLVLDRRISFRGDTDDSWRHAASFTATSLRAGIEGN
jgi:Protein of unknown function (DUF2380)